jgi:hypothetical protein
MSMNPAAWKDPSLPAPSSINMSRSYIEAQLGVTPIEELQARRSALLDNSAPFASLQEALDNGFDRKVLIDVELGGTTYYVRPGLAILWAKYGKPGRSATWDERRKALRSAIANKIAADDAGRTRVKQETVKSAAGARTEPITVDDRPTESEIERRAAAAMLPVIQEAENLMALMAHLEDEYNSITELINRDQALIRYLSQPTAGGA